VEQNESEKRRETRLMQMLMSGKGKSDLLGNIVEVILNLVKLK
jgi:hypothetical protein